MTDRVIAKKENERVSALVRREMCTCCERSDRSGVVTISSHDKFDKVVKQEKPANILSSQYLEQLNFDESKNVACHVTVGVAYQG